MRLSLVKLQEILVAQVMRPAIGVEDATNSAHLYSQKHNRPSPQRVVTVGLSIYSSQVALRHSRLDLAACILTRIGKQFKYSVVPTPSATSLSVALPLPPVALCGNGTAKSGAAPTST